MIATLLLFGATGDLAGRLLFPALGQLHAAGKLPHNFRIVATSRRDWDDVHFRHHMAQKLEQHAQHVPEASREALVDSTSHLASDVSDAESVRAVVKEATSNGSRPVAVYLALPQGVFPSLSAIFAKIDLPQGSRLVIEKPFGEDLAGAIALNQILEQVAGDAGEHALYRVDHVLGMSTVQNLLRLRFANTALEPLWNSTYIDQVDVLWEETLALEGRATFYDKAGALKDVLQNHMLQILCYAAMEPPASHSAEDIQDRKVALLNAMRIYTPDDLATSSQRARYTSGVLAITDDTDGRRVPDYTAEEDVDPGREAETFAEIVFAIDNDRWRGTRFVLRAGKALSERHKEVRIHFKPSTHEMFGQSEPNLLRIGIDGPLDMSLRINSPASDSPMDEGVLTLTSPEFQAGLLPYANVLEDILSGGSGRSVRGDEAEASWRAVMPVLNSWAAGEVPMKEYQAGTAGPPRLIIPAEE